jgi:DNA-damage-inducible protein J
MTMAGQSSMLHVRIDDQVKERAQAALEAMGLSVSDAVRLLMHRIAADQAFPLELKVPNAKTRAAMVEAEKIVKKRR